MKRAMTDWVSGMPGSCKADCPPTQDIRATSPGWPVFTGHDSGKWYRYAPNSVIAPAAPLERIVQFSTCHGLQKQAIQFVLLRSRKQIALPRKASVQPHLDGLFSQAMTVDIDARLQGSDGIVAMFHNCHGPPGAWATQGVLRRLTGSPSTGRREASVTWAAHTWWAVTVRRRKA
jgi:hypothetical protein